MLSHNVNFSGKNFGGKWCYYHRKQGGHIMTRFKKIIASIVAAASVSAVGISGVAASSASMTVDGDVVFCEHIRDIVSTNPFYGDTVTANASTGPHMEMLQVTATVHYTTAFSEKSKSSNPVIKNDASFCSASITAGGYTTGFGGAGTYYAFRNGEGKKVETNTGKF